MDPTNREPEEYDRSDEDAGRRRQSRDPLTPEYGHQARTVQLISGDFVLTVNPVDGSEIEPCRPGARPAAPVRHTAAERTERERATAPPVPPGPPARRCPSWSARRSVSGSYGCWRGAARSGSRAPRARAARPC